MAQTMKKLYETYKKKIKDEYAITFSEFCLMYQLAEIDRTLVEGLVILEDGLKDIQQAVLRVKGE